MLKKREKFQQALYGYCLGDNLEFRIAPALLVNTLTGISMRLRPTMARLLQYILNHSNDRMIEDKKIMKEVFEDFGLKCNKQRLWQAINALKNTLFKSGCRSVAIHRVNNCGFLICNVQVSVLISYPINNLGMTLPLVQN